MLPIGEVTILSKLELWNDRVSPGVYFINVYTIFISTGNKPEELWCQYGTIKFQTRNGGPLERGYFRFASYEMTV